MRNELFFAVWYFIPAGVANSAPVLAQKLPLLRHWTRPIDNGIQFRGKELLGRHKTWRGLISGMIASLVILYVQQILSVKVPFLAHLLQHKHFSTLPTLLLGPLFGLSALGGDAIESLIKRQRGIPSGRSWIPFDQVDYILGAILATYPIIHLSVTEYVFALIIWPISHVVIAYAGYRFKLKETPI